MKYHLITSLPTKNQNKGDDYLFLDSFFLKDLSNFDKKFNFKIFNLKDNNLKKTKDFLIKANTHYLNLLKYVTQVLNNYHDTNFSIRYWEILLGHWLQKYNIAILYKKFLLENLFLRHDIKKITLYDSSDISLISRDTISSIWGSNSQIFHDFIMLEILKKNQNLSSKIRLKKCQSYFKKYQIEETHYNSKLSNFICNIFPFRNKEMITHTHLSKLNNLKLNFIHKNFFPNNYVDSSIDLKRCDREKLVKNFIDFKNKDIQSIFVNLLPKLIPYSFVENYKNNEKKILKLNWPCNPNFIFTSSRFFGDEVFKIWLAKMVENKVKYFAGQHGNNYGAHFYFGNKDSVERRTSDYFISWGWKEKNTNVIPGFYYKKPLKKNANYKQSGLLIINPAIEHRFVPWDVVDNYLKRLNYLQLFLSNININIYNNTILRFPGHKNNFTNTQLSKLNKIFEKVKKDYYKTKLQNLIKKSKLTVFSYDSTGILDYLNADIPFIGFWPGSNEYLIKEKQPIYNLLYKNNILFKDPIIASNFVSENWNNLDKWWESKNVKYAKSEFIKNFCKYEKNISKSLAEILKSH